MTTDDIRTLIWKESKEIFQQGSSRTGNLARIIFPIVIVGIINPWMAGEKYLTSRSTFGGLLWILLFVTISVTVDSFAGERERHTLETLLATRLSDDAILFGKLIASIAYEWLSIVVTLVLGVATVNLVHGRPGTFLMFPANHAVALLVWTFLASILLSSVAVLISLRAPTVRQASQTLAFGTVILFFAALFGFQKLPASWQKPFLQMLMPENLLQTKIIIGIALAVLSFAALALARFRFRRAQLVLD